MAVVRRILLIIFALLVLSVIVFQIWVASGNTYTTEVAYRYTAYDTLSAQGVVFRDETVVDTDKENTVVYEVSDGSKITAGYLLANIYEHEEDAQKKLDASKIDSEIEILNTVKSQSVAATLPDSVIKQIFSQIGELNSLVDGNDFTDAGKIREDFMTALFKRDLSVGREIDFDSHIAELTQQVEQLEASITSSPTPIYASNSGYFISTVDGLEDDCTADKMEDYTSAEIIQFSDSAKNAQETSKIGKIMESYEWYYAAVIPISEAGAFREGQKLLVSFAHTEVEDTEVTVIGIEKETNNAIVYFESDRMTSDIANLRAEDIDIRIDSYEGLRISSGAVRVDEDGQLGVFVLEGQEIRFKKIDILYETSDYVVADINSTDSDYIKVFDEVILEGSDLYDGKIV